MTCLDKQSLDYIQNHQFLLFSLFLKTQCIFYSGVPMCFCVIRSLCLLQMQQHIRLVSEVPVDKLVDAIIGLARIDNICSLIYFVELVYLLIIYKFQHAKAKIFLNALYAVRFTKTILYMLLNLNSCSSKHMRHKPPSFGLH